MPQPFAVMISRVRPDATVVSIPPAVFTDAELERLILDLQREEVAGRIARRIVLPADKGS